MGEGEEGVGRGLGDVGKCEGMWGGECEEMWRVVSGECGVKVLGECMGKGEERCRVSVEKCEESCGGEV